MDFVQRCGVKIPNAVIISGATQVVGQDGQIIDFLKKYGSIKNTFSVDEETSEFHQNLIVEYSYGTAVEDLRAILPYRYTVQDDPCIVYTVRTLCSVYQAEVGANITKNYLTELKTLARLSGIEYEQVLKGMMSQISEDIEAMSPVIEEGSPMHSGLTIGTPQIVAPGSLSDALQGNIGPNVASSVPIFNEGRAPSLSVSSMNPQEVQKVVVEHIVRREDVVPHLPSQVRLRSFSGKAPRPSNEADYTWRSHIELLLNDPNMSPLQTSRKILESLLAPAADVVKGLRPDSSPSTYLQLLDSAFGTVEDGEELFAQFLNTLQDPGERPSTYLHRLQVAISLAVKRGGVAPLLVDKHLLKQFCRGCWDNALLSTLQLEQRKSSPPPSIVHDSPQMLLNCTNMLFNDPL
uniref:Paraneoplastic antigen Ma-like C-terminal domain-containing protein n=1 Tax=Paramormyrops kingsleyae TaxID=1676925 RepID=A0A3B3RMR2_9TELE